MSISITPVTEFAVQTGVRSMKLSSGTGVAGAASRYLPGVVGDGAAQGSGMGESVKLYEWAGELAFRAENIRVNIEVLSACCGVVRD